MRISASEKKVKESINYFEMDRECVNLCKAINEIPALCTLESCCGHGKSAYDIYFRVTSLKGLSLPLGCIHGKDDWAVYVYAVYYGDWPKFILTGPIADFKPAERLAKEIRREWTLVQMEEEERKKARTQNKR